MKWKKIVLVLALFSIMAAKVYSAPKAYVAEFGSNDVAVIATGENRVLKHIPVPKGAHGLVITPDGSRVFVSSDESSVISVIDTRSDSVIAGIPTGKAPHGLIISPDGGTVFAAIFGDNQILQINARTLKVVRALDAPAPHNLALTPDATTLYVAAQQPGKTGIARIDLASGRMSLMPTDTVPRSLNLSPRGDILTVTEFDKDQLFVFSTEPLKQIASVPVGQAPHHTIFTPDGKRVLVCSQASNDVAVIDPHSWSVLARITVGGKPHWIAPSTDGEYAYVTDESSGQVSILDLDDNTLEGTIQVGSAPRKIALQPGALPQAESKMKVAKNSAQDKLVVVKMGGEVPRFTPQTLTIPAGTTVQWVNVGKKVHTVTGESWDSGALAPGEKFKRRFDKKGTFAYYCIPHRVAGMVGTIIVD